MFEPDLVLREKVFRKMRIMEGLWTTDTLWEDGEGHSAGHLPRIEIDWQITAEFLIKFMRERGYGYEVSVYNDKLGHYFVWYGQVANGKFPDRCRAEITDDDLPLAACEAFLLIDLEDRDAEGS